MTRRVIIAHAGSMALASALAQYLVENPDSADVEIVDPVAREIELYDSLEPPSDKRFYVARTPRQAPRPRDLYKSDPHRRR